MADENGGRRSLSAAGGRMEGVRQRIVSKVEGAGKGEGGDATTPSGLPAPQAGPHAAAPRECKPEHIRWLVKLIWKWGWKGAAKFVWGVELEDELFPDEQIDAIAEDACPVVDRHMPWLVREAGPEGALAVTVIESGAMPAAQLRRKIREKEEEEEDEDEAGDGWASDDD